LLGCSSNEVQQDRLAACSQLQQRYNCQGVLKGAGSIVFGSETVTICAHGNPGMATAGMGDVLSGVLGGLFASAQEAPLNTLSRLSSAVALHSAAADQAAVEIGQRSLLATDVINQLPMLLRGEG
jgi:NAD(P)H-hydrate repair Nnr-like enzyme with NAD(P)H-hydrate dehydratase domain